MLKYFHHLVFDVCTLYYANCSGVQPQQNEFDRFPVMNLVQARQGKTCMNIMASLLNKLSAHQ